MKKIISMVAAISLICGAVLSVNASAKVTESTTMPDNTADEEDTNTTATQIPEWSILYSDHENAKENGISYYVYDDFAWVIDFDESKTELVVPDTFDNKPVTNITLNALRENYNIKSLTLPKYYDRSHFFSGVFPNLREINISPENKLYSSIDGILYNKEQTELLWCPPKSTVTELTIPSTVEKIDCFAFTQCHNLEYVSIPGNVKLIDEGAFCECSNLSEAELGEGIETIAPMAFATCKKLYNVNIPDSVKSIGWNAFSESPCGEMENGIHYIGKWAVDSTDNIVNATVREGTVNIAEDAFCSKENLTSLNIPSSVKNMGTNIAKYCENLKIAFIYNDKINEDEFFGCTSLSDIYIYDISCEINENPENFRSEGRATAFHGSEYSTAEKYAADNGFDFESAYPYELVVESDLAQENGCTYIITDYYAKLSVVPTDTEILEIPSAINGIPVIGAESDAFIGCTNLKKIIIPEYMQNFDADIFECTELSEIEVNENNENFRAKNGMLYSKDMKTLITAAPKIAGENPVIEDHVKKIADYAFYNYDNIKSVKIPSSVNEIGDCAFFCCESLESISLGSKMEKIGSNAFLNCENLGSVTLPDTVKYIGYNAFDAASYETEKDGIGYIGNWAVHADKHAEKAVFEEGTVGICSDIFAMSADVTEITVPSSVKYFSSSIVPSLVIKSDAKLYCPAISADTFSSEKEYTPISDYYFYDPDCLIPDTEKAIPELYHSNPRAPIDVDTPKIKGWQTVGRSYMNNDPFLRQIINESLSEEDEHRAGGFIAENSVIHGYAGSTAESYAKKYGRKFELISGEPPISHTENDILYGDANCDEQINLADVVLIMQSISNPDVYGLKGNDPTHITEQGMLNGDVKGNDGITNLDALTIQKYMLDLITKLPE